jgi:hypothetical protein
MTTEHPHHELRRPTASSQPISILLQAFSDISGIESDMYDVLSPEFARMVVKARNVFYNNGDIANELFIVEQSELVLKLNIKKQLPGGRNATTWYDGCWVGVILQQSSGVLSYIAHLTRVPGNLPTNHMKGYRECIPA